MIKKTIINALFLSAVIGSILLNNIYQGHWHKIVIADQVLKCIQTGQSLQQSSAQYLSPVIPNNAALSAVNMVRTIW